MDKEKVYAMKFSAVYPLLVNKALRKGRSREEVDSLTTWLTGYSAGDIDRLLDSELTYGEFFKDAPALNPDYVRIKGSICGVRVEEIVERPMREIRGLDKLVDELAKGKPVEKILNLKNSRRVPASGTRRLCCCRSQRVSTDSQQR